MSSAPFIFRILNPVMMTLLKSPLHTLISDKILIITFNGRKSGKSYSTPVSYYQENGYVYCFTHASWWKNMNGGAKVRLLIRRVEFTGIATPIHENREKKIASLGKLLTAVPNDAVYYDVRKDQQGNLDQGDLARAVDDATMIEIRLEGSV